MLEALYSGPPGRAFTCACGEAVPEKWEPRWCWECICGRLYGDNRIVRYEKSYRKGNEPK